MPSDVNERVRDALAKPRELFRSTLVSSHEEVRAMLSEAGRSDEDRADALASELGPFAAGRIDAGRLATVLAEKRTVSPEAREVLRRAADVLEEMLEHADGAPAEAEVPPGGDLRDVVREALEEAGRFFGAARAAALARTGAWSAEGHEELFEGLPFRQWTLRERSVAPALVVRVRGEDLRPAGLGDFLDGALKVVLLVEGTAPPAALARLLTPGAMVVQATDADRLASLSDFPGPGVAALFEGASSLDGDGGVVRFVHDPRWGAAPWERVRIEGDVEELRGLVADRRWKRAWKEDVEHLLSLATVPAGAAPPEESAEAAGESVEEVTGADRLASWLLARTDLDRA